MQSLSVFRPSHPRLYTVIGESTILNSVESSDGIKNRNTREWGDLMTTYVMLKYRKWQIKDRRTMSLHSFHQRCSEELFNDLGINKTPTQIRDKVNNTRSSYHALIKQLQKESFKWTQEKHYSLSKPVFDFMSIFFESNNTITLDQINQKIVEVIQQNKS
ncbi:hypothetical protein EHI8A_067600 [Entamoeba histolytica HM-1:IMSS-B]|uniref:Myb/SANT-like domain-containing protein n=8 Tax=Entamoeba TaxID=5758 RepID=B1N2J1_ENTH1|nr:hypothetical protein EHI_050390 [Entamoeba histolytica HM-1:IMSS]XP_008859731.1 hypothetical protein ENU1_181960 [Entamoeba nuttalli P19]EMD46281.1 Hypothetical protein EHI5A_100350 [Entamoeba histolytica KU27]EMH75426.1 hypothetical protein EHI8A_067600 [Entamoeba histolytica HM-1:IMSS-B]EMS13869.1 hypothetical protein KM1_106510 [Entamoeba histolytica HM-3:IMSS]ENY61358.1 hypothetical protein EHI7A_065170 [Entamoeba histolytica HM-1:IMSS-A]GAT91968.1 hypothetical protein CL6EHI_050390 [E|eukprot:XP_008859731.1 hypothetical protein ENU1_181960 [Entamoeba nuttalli P19]